MPRSSSYSRRKIRAIADGTSIDDAAHAPPISSWGNAGMMGVSVLLDPSLWSPHDDEPGATREEIDAQLRRVAMVLAELESQAPYGKIYGYQAGFKWVTWERNARGHDRPVKFLYWGTTMVKRPVEALASVRSAVQGVLALGPQAEALRRYQLMPGGNGRPIKRVWVEVPEFTVRWVCGDCRPGTRRETRDVRRLRRS